MSIQVFKKEIWPVRHKLYRFALRIVQNAAEAEDVVQEVMARLWRGRERWAEIDDLEAWCMRLTRNMAIDHLRSRQRRRTEPADGLTPLAAPDRSPLERAEQRDVIGQLRQLVENLPINQRLVWHLREIEQLTYQEIGERLQMPMTQVKINLFRARNKLKEALLKHEKHGLSNN